MKLEDGTALMNTDPAVLILVEILPRLQRLQGSGEGPSPGGNALKKGICSVKVRHSISVKKWRRKKKTLLYKNLEKWSNNIAIPMVDQRMFLKEKEPLIALEHFYVTRLPFHNGRSLWAPSHATPEKC